VQGTRSGTAHAQTNESGRIGGARNLWPYQIQWKLAVDDIVVVSLPLILGYYLIQRWIVAGFMGTSVNK